MTEMCFRSFIIHTVYDINTDVATYYGIYIILLCALWRTRGEENLISRGIPFGPDVHSGLLHIMQLKLIIAIHNL